VSSAGASRVAESWGGAQTTAGVLLAIPVETTRVVIEQSAAGRETQRTEVQRNVLYVLPDSLNVSADVKPYYRSVGLYRTPVYEARVDIAGNFVNRDYAHLMEAREGREVKWNEARLLVLNSQSRALRGVDDLWVAGESPQVAADAYAGSAGISAFVPAQALREDAVIPFRLKLTLAGSSQLTFLPLARRASISMKSTWAHPKFEGAPAPLDPQISDAGFSAQWSVLEINRSFGQSWWDNYVGGDLDARSAFAGCSSCLLRGDRGFTQPRRAHHQIVALRQAGRLFRRRAIEQHRGRPIAGPLQKMGAHRGEPMVAAEAFVRFERYEKSEARVRTVHHGCGDRMVERHHRVVGHS